MNRTAWPRRAEGLALVVTALGALAFHVYLPTTHVREDSYREVAAILEAEARPGDVVLLWPWWTDRARLHLPPAVEVVGYLGSDGADFPSAGRIWVLGQPRLPRADRRGFEAAFLPGRTSLGPRREVGNLTLELFANGRARPVTFSLAARLEQARVSWELPDGRSQPCAWNGRAHQCPGGQAVQVSWREVHYEPVRCVTFDAPPSGARLVVELPGVPASAALLVRAGYIWEFAAYRDGVTDAQLVVEAGGQRAEVPLPRGVEAFHRRELEGIPDGATLRMTLEAPSPNARHVCVEATGLGGAS